MRITIAMHRAPSLDNVKDYANDALNNFRDIENITLDYSIASLEQIDTILLEWKKQAAPVSLINKSLYAMASYAGECVLQHLPGQWRDQRRTNSVKSAFIYTQFENGLAWYPIYQVFALMLAPESLNAQLSLTASLKTALASLNQDANHLADKGPGESEIFSNCSISFVLNDADLASSLPDETIALATTSKPAGTGLAGLLSQLKTSIFGKKNSPEAPSPAPQKPASGFIAGTLVHTQNGLVPIEQIKVGDSVLALAEKGAKPGYQRVLKTFAYEPKRILQITYKIPETDRFDFLWATPNHPFRLVNDGWTAAEDFGNTNYRVLINHAETEIEIRDVKNIYITDQADIGWMPKFGSMLDDWGDIRRFNPPMRPEYIPGEVFAIPEVEHGTLEDPYFKQAVFNLQLEHNAGWYVGELGILVQ